MIAQRRVLRESAIEHAAHVVRDSTRAPIDRGEICVSDAQEDIELTPAGEERPHGHHLREHDSDGEEIAAMVQLFADDLLGRHVPELAFELSYVRTSLELRGARDAEIRELHGA